ncbi:uncharacterized protein LOC144584797 [Pogona vitticeps]
MLKAGALGFFFPTLSPQFLPHLPLRYPEFVPAARHWETPTCPERWAAQRRRLGVVLSVSSFTRMQSFIVRLRHPATSRNDRIQKGRRDMASCLQSPSQLGFEFRGGDS